MKKVHWEKLFIFTGINKHKDLRLGNDTEKLGTSKKRIERYTQCNLITR